MNTKKRNTMDNEERNLYTLIGIAVMGTVIGFLLELAVKESTRNFKQIAAAALLNGAFTVGAFSALRWFVPDITLEIAVGISALLSSIGRGAIIHLVSKWMDR